MQTCPVSGAADWLLPGAGLLCGLVLGAVARWNHFCTLAALERHWYANDSRSLRTWVLSAAVALLGTQGLLLSGVIELDTAFVLSPQLNLLGAVSGGLLFGVGMALTGTCAFGALVRLGGGSLRSLVVVVAIALAALTAQRGLLGHWRLGFIDPLAIELGNARTQSLGDLLSQWLGLPLHLPVALLATALLMAWVFADASYRRDHRGILTGSIVGACVTFGWFATSTLGNHLFSPVQIESASFVMPPGDLLLSVIAVTGGLPDYGVGLVIGVAAGAMLAARLRDDMRWEACDDARELSRHLLGAFLMGTGGVLASGCTLGQGVSAMSVMALSAPIVFISICLGARIGLVWLLEGFPAFLTRSG
ncbi:MAG: YeeE/YedE family protein [Granulosicoccus sp.]|nr:YeeE/YedE family protein [Granulosicoccus sp.]